MSVIIYSMDPDELVSWMIDTRPAGALDMFEDVLVSWELPDRPADDFGPTEQDYYWPYPIGGGVRARYRNKCRDSITGIWTPWYTNYQDLFGAEYPGSGFDAGTYRVAGIVYDREQ